MKPVCLCLVQMGQKGLELIESYPKVIPDEEMATIALKSMPIGAKEGDFSTNTVGKSVISGYVFRIPAADSERDNIGSLVAVFNDMNYDPLVINKVFSFTIDGLNSYNLISVQNISEILPSLYNGIIKGELKIKVSSITTLEMTVGENKEKKNSFDSFGEDVW